MLVCCYAVIKSLIYHRLSVCKSIFNNVSIMSIGSGVSIKKICLAFFVSFY